MRSPPHRRGAGHHGRHASAGAPPAPQCQPGRPRAGPRGRSPRGRGLPQRRQPRGRERECCAAPPRASPPGLGHEVGTTAAGKGGRAPCIPDPEDPKARRCFGTSGALTAVTHGPAARRDRSGPSLAGPNRRRTPSAHRRLFTGRRSFVMASASARCLGAQGAAGHGAVARHAGQGPAGVVGTGRLRRRRRQRGEANPDGKRSTAPGGDPAQGSRYLVADAGGNAMSPPPGTALTTVAVSPSPAGAAGAEAAAGHEDRWTRCRRPSPAGAEGCSTSASSPVSRSPSAGPGSGPCGPGRSRGLRRGAHQRHRPGVRAGGSLSAVQIATHGLLQGPKGSLVKVSRTGGKPPSCGRPPLAVRRWVQGRSAYVAPAAYCVGAARCCASPWPLGHPVASMRGTPSTGHVRRAVAPTTGCSVPVRPRGQLAVMSP